MKIRYIISEKWESQYIVQFIAALNFGIKYLKLEGHLTVKLINGTDEATEEATAEAKKNKRYEIRIARNRLNQDEPLRALFHELVHVKQFAVDGLKAAKDGWEYKGSRYKPFDSLESYLLAPWEMEARAMEEAMICLFEEGL